jgi:hypothetical protein
MTPLSSAREKNVRWRRRARIHRSTNRTPASALALSRGLRTRAGTTATPSWLANSKSVARFFALIGHQKGWSTCLHAGRIQF